jgi:NADH-quinone oxidoreductase subunit H
VIVWALTIVIGTYAVALLQRRMTTGQWQPLLLIGRGSIARTAHYSLPEKRDKVFYGAAPVIMLTAVVLAAAVLPLTKSAIAVDLATGALFVSAALAYVMAALVLAGWSSNEENGMMGAWRILGQFIAYSMPVVMTITAVAMRAESLSTTAIVQSQANLWNIAYQPLGFVLFFTSFMALAFLPPFDLPIASSEIKDGVFSGFAGWRLKVMRLARLLLILVAAWTITVFFLGGWQGPFLPDWLWSSLKIGLTAAVMLWIGRFIPRFTVDKVQASAWKIAIPLALTNIFIVGAMLLGGIQ